MHRKYVQGKRANRKPLKHAPSHQQSESSLKMVQSDIQSQQQHVEFLSRVANIPVVHSAIEYASDAYTKAKVI